MLTWLPLVGGVLLRYKDLWQMRLLSAEKFNIKKCRGIENVLVTMHKNISNFQKSANFWACHLPTTCRGVLLRYKDLW